MTKDNAANLLEIDAITRDLRAWLRARPEDPPNVASAVVYELAALIAVEADTVEQAIALADFWHPIMVEQIRRFGAGHEHPV